MDSAQEMDVGFQALRAWLSETGIAPADAKIRHLVGDVSRRRYLRLEAGEDGTRSMVLALYPEDMESAYERFLCTTELLSGAGIPVPEILARDSASRFMAIEDVGDRALYGLAVGSLEAEKGYLEAVEYLPRLRGIDHRVVEGLNPPLGRKLFRWELDQTRKLFFSPALSSSPQIEQRLAQAHGETLERLAAQRRVVCHRDLMARNIQLTSSGIVVLDHQDLRMGPPGYDLASLLHDSLRLSPRQRQLVESRGLEVCAEASPEQTSREAASYWLCVVQRTSKIIGTFCSFALRGGRRHLPLIPAAVESLCEGLGQSGLWPKADEELAPPLLQYWSANLDDFGRQQATP